MKTVLSLTLSIVSAISLPQTYPAPPDGWESIEYPDGTGENLDYYPPPPGGWASVECPGGTGQKQTEPFLSEGESCSDSKSPTVFTSTFHITAVPEEVVNGTDPTYTGGLAGCTGYLSFGLNSDMDLICWKITLTGFEGEYSSPANTATHIHEAGKGKSGLPRIVFPTPSGDGHERYSFGCMTGPFTPGVVQDDVDTGEGFTVKAIEDNPSLFYADVHSSLAVPGAVRGQLG